MKAWRKHNMEQAAIVKHCLQQIAQCNYQLRYAQFLENREYYHSMIRTQEAKIKTAQNYKLRTKTERRGQYAAEICAPSQNLYLIMAHAGIKVPEEFMSHILMQVRRQNAARSTASNLGT